MGLAVLLLGVDTESDIVAGVDLLQLLHGLHDVDTRTGVVLLSLLSLGRSTLRSIDELNHGLVQPVGLLDVVLAVPPLHAAVHFLQQLIGLYHVAARLIVLPDPGCLDSRLGQGLKHLPGSAGELVGFTGFFGQVLLRTTGRIVGGVIVHLHTRAAAVPRGLVLLLCRIFRLGLALVRTQDPILSIMVATILGIDGATILGIVDVTILWIDVAIVVGLLRLRTCESALTVLRVARISSRESLDIC